MSGDLFPDDPCPEDFTDRQGKVISREQWKALQEVPNYCFVRRYENGTFRCEAKWGGFRGERFTVYWGRIDDKMHIMSVLTEKSAIDHYESLVAENTESEWVKGESSWHLMEVGNKHLAPNKVIQMEPEGVHELPAAIETNPSFGTW